MIIGSNKLFYEILGSTNDEASEMLRKGIPEEGTLVYTDFQTSGRGQPGKSWESEPGKNLLLSIILYPESVEPGEQFLISIMVSLGISDMILKYPGNCLIKWPNDIYSDDDKIAGILIENSIMGGKIASSVIGTGININQVVFPGYIPNAVSLRLLTGEDHNRDLLLNELMKNLDIRYKQLLYGDRERLREEYVSRLYRLGSWHEFTSAGIRFQGKIIGVSDGGKLRMENKSGKVKEFGFKEVEYLI